MKSQRLYYTIPFMCRSVGIASRFYLSENDFAKAINESNAEKPKKFSELIDFLTNKKIESALKILRAIKNDKTVKKEKLDEILDK